MFKNVLVVDDHASVNHGIVQTLRNNTSIQQVTFTQYCEDAYIKFLKAHRDGNPFDLVISDIGFKQDYRKEKIKSGLELVKLLREKQPAIKVVIYSIEDRKTKIQSYIKRYELNGFISKNRHGLKELIEALPNVWNGALYTSKSLSINTENVVFEIDEFDIILLQELAKGKTQKEVSLIFKIENAKSNSLSSIEKKLNKLKIHFKAKNTIHLISICKDLGVI